MEASVDSLFQNGLVFQNIFHFECHVADNHRKSEVLHRTCPRICLAPLPLRIRTPFENPGEYFTGDLGVLFVAGSLCELGETHAGECVGEYIVWLNERASFAIKREIEIPVFVVSVFFQELGALDSAVEPFLIFLYIIVKHCEHPHFSTLKPDKFVSVINRSVTIQT